ncbi:GNAT family N-acetyltransferase [Butyrivibrio sp. AE2032]|uniref:GNAT family N-acetyltransferase n=1 Tax=Butyrivibrio sp. AE2032 TaxID=1458463 RepID=UPI0005571AE8|nr:GNAT family N-acetyltransferase [Butyrivibrio sp. AE2032]
MTNSEIKEIALRQSAEDIGCQSDDFMLDKNIVVPFCLGKNARKYYKEPITSNFVSYGSNIVAATTEEVADLVTEYIGKFEFYHCFETPNLHWLNDKLAERGHKVCFMAEYYLPDVNRIPDAKCLYETRILVQEDFKDLYLPEWSNALCSDRKNLDVLGIGAYDNDRLIGFAACSADCDEMWQIGVDVLPEYRQKGIASALTSKLAREILNRGKVPFYCSAWSNIRSARNAAKSGFIPAWVEMTVKPTVIVDEMNFRGE